MARRPRRWPVAVAGAVLITALGGCTDTGREDVSAQPSLTSPATSQVPSTAPSTSATATAPAEPRRTVPKASPRPVPTGDLVYFAGRRARTGELLLFAEQREFTGREELLEAVRSATDGTPVDPDYTSLWGAITVRSVELHWDGDEGFYAVRLADDATGRRPAGMTIREAHLAIQQVVWTLHSVGEILAPVAFYLGDVDAPVSTLLGIPATGPYGTYPAADYTGVLNSMNILTPHDGATVDGAIEISGLAESFEATVAVRVFDPNGEIVHEYSTQATQCCGGLFAFSYTLDTTGWPPGDYTLMCTTDDPLGIEQGSDGPEIDTKTITVR